MGSSLWRSIVRFLSILLLLNIGLGLYLCLNDDPITIADHAVSLSGHRRSTPETTCGDNCDSCICHALIIIAGQVTLRPEPVVARVSNQPVRFLSDPDLNRTVRPPRA